MPLLVHGVAWWLTGLLAGSVLAMPVALLLAGTFLVTLAAWVLERRDPRWIVAPWLGVAAAALAGISARQQAACTTLLERRLASGAAAWLVLDDHPTAQGRGTAVGRGALGMAPADRRCAIPATSRWSGAPPPAGQWVAVTARPTRTTRGLRLDGTQVIRGDGPHDPWRRWRSHLGLVIDGAFRNRAPLVRALLVADQHGIDPEVRDRFADAGLVHALSVSGMHVAIIASAILTLGSLLRLPRRLLEPLSLALVAAYVLLLGCPPPAVRSAVMLAVMALSVRWQRPVHDWTALALGAVVPTTDPLVVTDLGWQLSVGGMAALVAARALRRRWRSAGRRPRRPATKGRRGFGSLDEAVVALGAQRGASGWLLGELLTGIVATAVTAPIIAWTFGRVSLVAPLSNLVAAPLIAVLQPALFLGLVWALLLAPWPSLAVVIPDATQPLMRLFDALADIASAPSWVVWPVAPTLATAVGSGLAAALVVRASAARRMTPWLLAAAAVAVITVWAPLLSPGPGQLEMHVLDVGQGDAIALRTPRGRWVLVDAGPRWQGGDAGRRTVVPYVRRLGGDVALFVLSHPHDDHAGGAESAVRALRPMRWWESAFVTTSPGYRAALEAVRQVGTAWARVAPGTTWDLDGVAFTVLAPDSAWTAQQHDANETSVVLRVAYGAHRMLLTGDAELEEEQWLLAHYPAEALRADVLKVGHHGSRTSSSPAFLDAVRPRVGIASLATGNRYGHPSVETLVSFLERGTPFFRTDLEGTVVVRTDGRRLEVQSGGERWTVPE